MSSHSSGSLSPQVPLAAPVMLVHPDAILHRAPPALLQIRLLLPGTAPSPEPPASPARIAPKNTGETPALAKMFNLSLMRVFIYKY